MEAFKHFDTNGDGKISSDELMQAMKDGFAGEASEEEIKQLLADVDKDGSGAIDYEEFCAMLVTSKLRINN